MRGWRGLLIGNIGLGACLLAGCLHHTLPPEMGKVRSDVSAHAAAGGTEAQKPSVSPSDYLVSPLPSVPRDAQPPATTPRAVEDRTEAPAPKPVEPVDMRVRSEASSSPAQPPSPPEPHMEVQPAPPPRPDAPCVQVLRGLIEHRSEGEINEQLKPYDPPTREAILLLSTSLAQLEQSGGISRISPRDLAVWSDRLNLLTASLRSRSQLILDRMCFCSYIRNFGDFAPLPTEHTFFQPGEVAHVYVQVRNFSSRRRGNRYVTALIGRVEIYDDSNRDRPPITWTSECREDVSASPRQDYYINFHFPMHHCPPGLYTMRITVEDWTDAPPGAKSVPESRIARRTLDFKVGGPIAHRYRIAETTPRH